MFYGAIQKIKINVVLIGLSSTRCALSPQEATFIFLFLMITTSVREHYAGKEFW